MPINPNIALQVRPPQFESPVNQLAKVLQMQGMQQEQGMNRLRADEYRMKMDEYKRGQEENALLSRLYSEALKPDGTIDRNRLFSGAASGGLGSRIPGMQETFAKQDKASVEADQAKFKLANERYGVFQKTMGALKDAPNLSKQLVMEVGANLVSQGIIPQSMYDGAVASMPDDPMQLRQRIAQGLATQLPPEEVFELFAPKPTQIDNGQTIGYRDTNPNSPTYGQDTGGAPVQRMQTPDNVASVANSAANNAATIAARAEQARLTREQAERQHRETMAHRREVAARAATPTADDGGTTQAALTKLYGKAEPGRRWKPDGTLEPIPGGSADRKTNEQMVGKETVDNVVASLRASFDALDKGGGITSTQKKPLENLSAAASRSGIGQVVGGAFGARNQKERDNIAQSRPLLLQAIMRASGMTSRQLDSNAELKLWLSTATDPTLTLEANKQALDRIADLYGSGSDAVPEKPKAAPGALGSGTSPVGAPSGVIDFNSLPPRRR
jgi:hypothetical protein